MHKVVAKYKSPTNVKFCNRCVVSNQRPRIRFDDDGICSACQFAEKKAKTIDWRLRENLLIKLLEKHRRRDGQFDVIVPASGGKDSGYVAHLLKHKYGMHPLTVTWAPHIFSDIGWKNFQSFIHSGFDNILGTPNGKVHRKMTKLAFELIGDPFLPFIYGQKNFPIRIAVNYKIPLVMYGENGEVEYGGSGDNEDSPTHNLDQDMTKHYFSGLDPEDLEKKGISKADLTMYTLPTQKEINDLKIECHFMGYYRKWIPQENYYYAQRHTGFLANPEGRSEGTYSKYASIDDRIDGFHYYLSFIKFGIGRATSDAAHEIRDGHITREEGVSLVQRFDGEFPAKHFAEFLDYCQMTEKHFWKVVDSFRSPHIWKKKNNKWKLLHQVS